MLISSQCQDFCRNVQIYKLYLEKRKIVLIIFVSVIIAQMETLFFYRSINSPSRSGGLTDHPKTEAKDPERLTRPHPPPPFFVFISRIIINWGRLCRRSFRFCVPVDVFLYLPVTRDQRETLWIHDFFSSGHLCDVTFSTLHMKADILLDMRIPRWLRPFPRFPPRR